MQWDSCFMPSRSKERGLEFTLLTRLLQSLRYATPKSNNVQRARLIHRRSAVEGQDITSGLCVHIDIALNNFLGVLS